MILWQSGNFVHQVSKITRLLQLLFSVCMTRFTCSLIYYALAWNTGTLYGNIYLNTFISATVEIPALVVSIYMMDRKPLGRRWTGFIGIVGTALSSFITMPMILFSKRTLFVGLSRGVPKILEWEGPRCRRRRGG